MAASSVNYPLKLAVRPDLQAGARPGAERVGMTVSGLVGVLVWNDHLRPNYDLAALPNPEKVTRVDLTISLRRPLREFAEQGARSRRMSLNAYLEALLAAHLDKPAGALIIFPIL